jgi:hypothetical protein
MIEKNKTKTGTVTLDIELQDLLEIVSKSGTKSPLSSETSTHIMEGEDLRKAWFKHVLISIEKLADLIETIRRTDISNLRTELKGDIKELERDMSKFNDNVSSCKKEVEGKISKSDDELKKYKADIIDPISNKVLTLTVKLGVWSIIAGFIGSGLMGLIIYILKEFFIKSALTGKP